MCVAYRGAIAVAYYLNKREFFDGALTLFQRDATVNSPNSKTHRQANWHMKVKIAGKKGRAITYLADKNVSTGERVLEKIDNIEN